MVAVVNPGTTLLGKYRLDSVLGEGGMGVVYRGTHLRLERPVAIKLLKPDAARDERTLRRFFEEARAAGKLRHPHVIDMLDVEMDGDTPFMVMEFLEGEPLSTLLEREGPLSVERVRALIDPVLDALEAAHEAGIVHRDIKPDNVFIAEVRGALLPKVLDFGIARLWDGGAALTDTGVAIGTPMYMAPEQAGGRRDAIGPWTDVWSVGVVLFEAFTGELHLHVHSSAGMMAWLTALATERPRRLAEVAPHLPASITAAVDAALDPDPEARPRDAAALRAMLFGGPASDIGFAATAASLPPPAAPSRPPSRARLWVALGIGALTLLGLVGAAMLHAPPPPPEPRPEAGETERRVAPPPPQGESESSTSPEPPAEEAAAVEPIAVDIAADDPAADDPAEDEGVERPPTRARPRPSRPREATPPGEPPSSPRTRTGRWNSDDY